MSAAEAIDWLVLLDLMGTVTKMNPGSLREFLEKLNCDGFDVAIATSIEKLRDVHSELAHMGLVRADYPRIIPNTVKYNVEDFVKLAAGRTLKHCIIVDNDIMVIRTAISAGMNAIHFDAGARDNHIYKTYAGTSEQRFIGSLEILVNLIERIRRDSVAKPRPKGRPTLKS